ncbi:MAG TPA: efflux transporter outer membrane subunit [Candidatus Binataceae bacterium]|nr:efflux transporter outer membrane subunit [Candidatus Binataceae bacterium]
MNCPHLCSKAGEKKLSMNGRKLRRPRAFGRSQIGAALVFLLAGCAVGPDFVRPAPPSVTAYTPKAKLPALTAGGSEPSQRFLSASTIPNAWWQLFHSRSLDTVVREAIANSPSLVAAQAAFARAHQAVLQAEAPLYPWMDFTAMAERQRWGLPMGLGFSPSKLYAFNYYAFGPTVSYSPDLFGLTRRYIEEQQATAQSQAYQLAAAYLTLTGNVVAEALTIASTRLQLSVSQQIVAVDEKNLELVQSAFEEGRIAKPDVLLAESQLSNDRALLPPLRQQLAAAQDALTMLVGKFPAQWEAPSFAMSDFTLPGELPVSLPSALVRQRPDILAAEAQLHASSAAVGVATAQMYPNITLSASLTPAALSPNGAFFQASNLFWSLIGGVTVPVFHGGALRAQKQAAIEQLRASFAIYRQAVLQAFQQVADTLRALGHDSELIHAERRAVETAHNSLALQQESDALGKTDILQLLDAQRSYHQAELGYAHALAQRYLDSAQLFVAMGGGWWKDTTLCGDCADRVRFEAWPAQTVEISPSR